MKFVESSSKIAIICDEKEYSFKEVISRAKGYGELLDIEKEDRAIIFMENRPELIFSFLGIWDKKGTVVTLDASFTGEELVYFIENSEPKYIFTSKNNKKAVDQALGIIGKSVETIVVDDIAPEYKGDIDYIEAPEKESVALMLYTSGTTGNPKGVMLTFDNILANIEGLDHGQMFLSTDRFLALLPMHHILPLLGTAIIPIGKGATVVFLKEVSSQAMIEALQKYKITVLIGVPRLWEMLHKKLMEKINGGFLPRTLFKVCTKAQNKALSKVIFAKVHQGFGGNVRFFVSGGSKLEPQVARDFKTLGIEMCEGYGLTETSPMISYNPIGNSVPGSAGIPLYNIEVKIAEDGEILDRGRNLMKGYFRMPDKTAEAIDSEGWFHTGDLGEIRDGRLYITGRKKEMIVLPSGKKINLEDVENEIMHKTSYVEEIAVLNYNNRLTALVLPNIKKMETDGIANTNLMETIKWEIIDKYNVNAPKYAKILDIKLVKEEIPRTKLGKIRRFMLEDFIKKNEAEGANGGKPAEKESPEASTPEFKAISDFIRGLRKGENVVPSSHLELDLGLDSLDMVELISYVETTFGVAITEEDFKSIQTVEQLCNLIRTKGGSYSEENVDWKTILAQPVEVELPKSAASIKFFKAVTAPLLNYYFGMDKEGAANIPDKPVIFAGNHQSLIDVFILNQILSNKKIDNTYYLAISTQVATPIRKYFAKHGNVLVIDINKNLKQTIQVMAQVLKAGKNLVIFPEGARTRDGELQAFKKAFAILSKELDIPIVPFGIDGAYASMPFGSKFPKKHKFSIKIFPEVDPKNLTVDEIVEKTRGTIKNWLEN